MSVFTEEEAKSLNAYQASGVFHPYTCGRDHEEHVNLFATTEGWHCPAMIDDGIEEYCDYTQTWAHGFTKDWSWKRLWKPGEDQ